MHATAARTHIIGHGMHHLRGRGHAGRTLLVPVVPTIAIGQAFGELDRVHQLLLCLGQNFVFQVALDVRPIQVAVLFVVHVGLVQTCGKLFDKVQTRPVFSVFGVKKALPDSIVVAYGFEVADSLSVDLIGVSLCLHKVIKIFSPLPRFVVQFILLDDLNFIVVGLFMLFLPSDDVVANDAKVVLEFVLLGDVEVIYHLHLLPHELHLLAPDRMLEPVLVQLVAPVAVSLQPILIACIVKVVLVEPLDELARQHIGLPLDLLGLLQLDLSPSERVFHYNFKFILFI